MTTLAESGLLPGEGILDRAPGTSPTAATVSLADQNVHLDRLARTRLRLLDSITEGIYQLDADGRCVFMNRAACRMLSYRLGEAIGKKMQEAHHGRSDALSVAAEYPIQLEVEQAVLREPLEDIFRRTDGSRFPVEYYSYPVYESGIHLGTAITFRDITERKRTERRLKIEHTVSRALESTASIEAMISVLLKSLGESLGLSWGALWQVREEERVLSLFSTWHPAQPELEDFEQLCRMAAFSQGEDLPGQVWKSAEAIWISELAGADLPHCAAAAGAGFSSGFAIPIRTTHSMFGVFEFFTGDYAPLDSDLLGVLGVASKAIGQAIESKQSESRRTRLSAVLDAATNFVGLVIDPRGTILSVSQTVESIFGFAESELVSQPLSVLIPEYRRHLRENVWPDDLGPSSFPLRSIRMKGRRKSGEPVPLELSLGECVDNGVRVIAGILQDVSELAVSQETLERQAEDLRSLLIALRQQTRLVNSIVTSMADGVIAADESGDIVLSNPAAARLGGDQPMPRSVDADTLTNSGLIFLMPDQRTIYPPDQMPLHRALRGETVDDEEMFVKTARRPEGFWVSATARPMLDDSDVTRGGVLVFRDVTEQKTSREVLRRAKDEAEAANRAKSEFLSRMSHELRTPMNAILGFGQLLEMDELTPEQSDAVARILKAGRHLLGLINEVLDISRIEAGHLNLQMERVRPFEVMEGAIELIGPLAAQRNIDLIPPSSSDAHWCIQADRQRLTQAFVNLLGNAVKYNRDRGQVRVSLEEVAGRKLRIKVADTGFGLSPEELKKLFIPFERLGAERSGIEGTGIGLAYSNRLVTAMGGTIGVESEVGKGTVFWVEAALSEFEEPAKHVSPPPSDAAASDEAGDDANGDMCLATILYIESDAASVLEIQEIIGRMPGYGLISAVQGSIGIQMALDRAPALVLVDFQLPDMDGMDVLKQLREPMSARKIPIVVVSAGLTDAVKRSALDAGAHDCIAKPIRRREFLDTVLCLT
jgi:PAS domain S-box-containing protein